MGLLFNHAVAEDCLSSQIAEWSLTKLKKKEERNFIYKVCVFRAARRINSLVSYLAEIVFDFSSTAERNLTKKWQKASHLSSLWIFGPLCQQRWPLWPLNDWGIIDFSAIAEREGSKYGTPYSKFVLSDRSVKKDGRLATDWLTLYATFPLQPRNRFGRILKWSKYFTSWKLYKKKNFIKKVLNEIWRNLRRTWSLRLLCNRWTKFDKNWQEASPVCGFSGRSVNKDDRFGIWMTESFSTSPLQLMNVKEATPYSKFVLSDRSVK